MKTPILLWLDDYRDPIMDQWSVLSPIPKPFDVVWVKNYIEFKKWIDENGVPDAVSFDHEDRKSVV